LAVCSERDPAVLMILVLLFILILLWLRLLGFLLIFLNISFLSLSRAFLPDQSPDRSQLCLNQVNQIDYDDCYDKYNEHPPLLLSVRVLPPPVSQYQQRVQVQRHAHLNEEVYQVVSQGLSRPAHEHKGLGGDREGEEELDLLEVVVSQED
jgi:hypothetical protein